MSYSDDNFLLQTECLRIHVAKMSHALEAAKQSTKEDERRAHQLEAAANADSVVQFFPLLFRRNEGAFMLHVSDKKEVAVRKIEASAYDALNWRSNLEKNNDTFTDTGRRWFY